MVEWCCLQWVQPDAWLTLGCGMQCHSAMTKTYVMDIGMCVGIRVRICRYTVGIYVDIHVGIRVGVRVGIRKHTIGMCIGI